MSNNPHATAPSLLAEGGGIDPLPAVKYQIVIMFLIAAGTSLRTVGVVLLGYRRLFTPDHQFLPNRLAKRG